MLSLLSSKQRAFGESKETASYRTRLTLPRLGQQLPEMRRGPLMVALRLLLVLVQSVLLLVVVVRERRPVEVRRRRSAPVTVAAAAHWRARRPAAAAVRAAAVVQHEVVARERHRLRPVRHCRTGQTSRHFSRSLSPFDRLRASLSCSPRLARDAGQKMRRPMLPCSRPLISLSLFVARKINRPACL